MVRPDRNSATERHGVKISCSKVLSLAMVGGSRIQSELFHLLISLRTQAYCESSFNHSFISDEYRSFQDTW